MSIDDCGKQRILPYEFNILKDLASLPVREYMTMVLIINGKGRIILNGKMFTLTPPNMLLISGKDKLEQIENLKLKAKSFSFSPILINHIFTFERLASGNFYEINDVHESGLMGLFLLRDEFYAGILDLPPKIYLSVSEWMSDIEGEVQLKTDIYRSCRIRRFLMQILFLLDDIYINRKGSNIITDEGFMVEILLEYIHANYPKEITLEMLCKLVNVNRTSLNRKFKDWTGRTPMAYLLSHRIKIACEALTNTKLSINKIAEATGFKYDTYFIKQFIKKIGISPTEYRQCEGFENLNERHDDL